ncbi:SPOR domain-containing protein [Chelatococcus sp. SYSU_G07232]|uniref:SPOR domain-containing protein n=1 Tax=Chelatococcus albus TaxID=3047466 RepID=A0ABT7ACN7_9HYPH|nr:SPOR domain-containing protein [Chelatococcus sp. SYSU_G07232]MDJ1157138.1 SPOR domain-containing protein [Chelatococcus sp. SYSU_G07232]
MHDSTKSRLALDLEEIERELKQVPASARPTRQEDPLAELARIVGQDDPFRAILSADRQAKPVAGARIGLQAAPLLPDTASGAGAVSAGGQFDDLGLRGPFTEKPYVQPPGGHLDLRDRRFEPVDDYAASPYAGRGGGAEVDQWSVDQRGYGAQAEDYQAYAQGAQAGYADRYDPYYDARGDGQPYADEAGESDFVPLEPRRSRKGLIAVATVLGIAVIGVSGVFALRGGSGGTISGEPPVIKADNEPAKVQPQNPGGVEIPNQNQQIYEKIGQDVPAQSKVVSREEQPVDVAQAIRRDVALAALPGEGAAAVPVPSPPQPTSPAAAALGEPKRVKTVSVRPDGTIVSDASAAPAAPKPAAATQPKPAGTTPAAAPVTQTAAPKPQVAAPARAAEAVGAPLSISPQAAQPRRVANAALQATTGEPEVTAATSAAAPAGAAGAFAVQLAAPGSEAEARSTFAALQRKHPDLAGHKPLVRKVEVGDRTIYRLRVGPMSREDATVLCTKLQAAGGQCFVARN